MKIAVDVCVGSNGVAMLREAGHEVLEAEHGEPDRAWLDRAAHWDVELLVSTDWDIEIFAYDHNIKFFRVNQNYSGLEIAMRVLWLTNPKNRV